MAYYMYHHHHWQHIAWATIDSAGCPSVLTPCPVAPHHMKRITTATASPSTDITITTNRLRPCRVGA
jgi:hypothetical protein